MKQLDLFLDDDYERWLDRAFAGLPPGWRSDFSRLPAWVEPDDGECDEPEGSFYSL